MRRGDGKFAVLNSTSYLKEEIVNVTDVTSQATQRLAVRHFLGHVKKELTIGLIGLAQQPPKLVEVAGVFARTTPRNVIRRFSLWKVRQFRWFLAVVEQLIEWALKSTGELFQGFDGRDSVAVLYAGNIATKQASALFDVPLGKSLFLAHRA